MTFRLYGQEEKAELGREDVGGWLFMPFKSVVKLSSRRRGLKLVVAHSIREDI